MPGTSLASAADTKPAESEGEDNELCAKEGRSVEIGEIDSGGPDGKRVPSQCSGSWVGVARLMAPRQLVRADKGGGEL